MKHLLRLSILIFAGLVIAHSSFALVSPSTAEAAKSEAANASPFAGMTMSEFMALTPKSYKEITGKKMSFAEKLSLKMMQHKLKKAAKNNAQPESFVAPAGLDTSDFNVGGFVLGLLLNVVGVLIAYLIGDETVIKWAWLGFGVVAVFFLLIWIL
ncbi:MAG TPA: hypothetical protein PK339_13055 [Flavitalea sp.]|nr:hypothetical protein [Flavitalea sp.]